MDPAVELLTDSSELSSADYPVLKLIKPSFSTGIGNTIDRIYRINKWIQQNLNDTLKLGPDILKPEILNPVTGKWIVSPVKIQGHYCLSSTTQFKPSFTSVSKMGQKWPMMTLKNSKKQNDWSWWNVKLNSHGCRWLLIAKWALKITFITSWGIILPELKSNINVKCTPG